MKKFIYTLALALAGTCAQAQVKVGNNPGTINPGSVLEMEATDKGMLMPRVALTATNTWGLAGTPAAGMVVYNTAAAGTGTTAVLANTMYLWNGTAWNRVSLNADNNNNNTTAFAIGEVRSSRMVVPYSAFVTPSGNRRVMNGKNSSNVTTTSRRSASEIAINNPTFLIVRGLRLDFMQSPNTNLYPGPKLYNTTSDPITYTVSSLSTNDAYIAGGNTTIAFNAYSFNVDGDDTFAANSDYAEYVNAMITFPNGEWYNCTWHATTDGQNFYFYTTAQRLN